MFKTKIFRIIIIAVFATFCIFTFISCGNAPSEPCNTIEKDVISARVAFGKKYYSLSYNTYTKNEYYTFNEDGTATYTHIMQDGDNVTYHQEINFKWTYAGEGDCILVHNGTKMIKGEQDDAFGISRVMHLSNAVVYWSASGENTYFISEDFANEIPDYAKLIKNN